MRPKLKYYLFPLFRPTREDFIDFHKEETFLFRRFFRFRSGNKRKLFVQFQFGIPLELRITSSKVIEANPYRKAITTLHTTWCVSAVENWKG